MKNLSINLNQAEKEFEQLLDIEKKLCDFSVEFENLVKNSKLSKSKIRLDAGNISKSLFKEALKGAAYNVPLDMIMYIAWVCGYHIKIEFYKKEQ